MLDGTVLGQVVDRDVYVSDPGYHYPAADFIANSTQIASAAQLAISGGATIVWSGASAFDFGSGSGIVSIGYPERPNRIVHHSLLQEGPPIGEGVAVFTDSSPLGTPISISLRFTEINCIPGHGAQLFSMNAGSGDVIINPLTVRDSFFGGMWFKYNPKAGSTIAVDVGNCLFERGAFIIDNSGYSGTDQAGIGLNLWNNLFFNNVNPDGGSTRIILVASLSNNPNWNVTDNIFEGAKPNLPGGVGGNFGNNWFSNVSGWGQPNEKSGSASYLKGPLGNRYQGNRAFQYQGSRSPSAAGLYQYTTRKDQKKDGEGAVGNGGNVDIGFHYVAVVEVTGVPVDSDGDGRADYSEDSDGNGAFDPSVGETSWTAFDGTGLTGNALTLFTPLK